MTTTATPDLERDFRAGMQQNQLVDKYGLSRSTIYRMAKRLGWEREQTVPADTPRKAPRRSPDKHEQVDPAEVDAALQAPDELARTLEVIAKHAEVAQGAASVAANAVTRGHKMIEMATMGDDGKMLKSPRHDMARTGIALINKGTASLEAMNRMYRRNRGLDGVTQIEHSGRLSVTADESREALEREFGFRVGRAQGQLAPLPVGIPDRPEPS